MRLSVLGFGCGAVGGLMVRGDWRDQERTVARAIDAGVNPAAHCPDRPSATRLRALRPNRSARL